MIKMVYRVCFWFRSVFGLLFLAWPRFRFRQGFDSGKPLARFALFPCAGPVPVRGMRLSGTFFPFRIVSLCFRSVSQEKFGKWLSINGENGNGFPKKRKAEFPKIGKKIIQSHFSKRIFVKNRFSRAFASGFPAFSCEKEAGLSMGTGDSSVFGAEVVAKPENFTYFYTLSEKWVIYNSAGAAWRKPFLPATGSYC